ncbi:hypothetical protein KOW79_002765 [Hemibagrus wyckioides]|uniref:Uncharacterized protein n=1 Tax=Hemibagrus wyckioides TaxID=337641 RepID=A0A9D3P486_9TELE|nr:hypothetical protein KOW79_002765 [Hemibagrus wyckioides]
MLSYFSVSLPAFRGDKGKCRHGAESRDVQSEASHFSRPGARGRMTKRPPCRGLPSPGERVALLPSRLLMLGACRIECFLLQALSRPPLFLYPAHFKDSKQIDSHVNTAKVGPQFSAPALNCWLSVYRLFVSRRVRMDRSNRKTNSHSQGHVKVGRCEGSAARQPRRREPAARGLYVPNAAMDCTLMQPRHAAEWHTIPSQPCGMGGFIHPAYSFCIDFLFRKSM